MTPRFKQPIREEWMTDEDYAKAVEIYENALDDYYSEHNEKY